MVARPADATMALYAARRVMTGRLAVAPAMVTGGLALRCYAVGGADGVRHAGQAGMERAGLMVTGGAGARRIGGRSDRRAGKARPAGGEPTDYLS